MKTRTRTVLQWLCGTLAVVMTLFGVGNLVSPIGNRLVGVVFLAAGVSYFLTWRRL